MFKDSKDGQTHYIGDGCNPAHTIPENNQSHTHSTYSNELPLNWTDEQLARKRREFVEYQDAKHFFKSKSDDMAREIFIAEQKRRL